MSKTIVLCSSGSFYKHVNEIAGQLEKMGYRAEVPATALMMKQTGDYNIDKVKTWYRDPKDKHIKTAKMRGHFQKIDEGDAILLVNDDKPGAAAYIGPNGFMEWGLAAFQGKPIYILNQVPRDAIYWEEALTVTVLDGDLAKIDL